MDITQENIKKHQDHKKLMQLNLGEINKSLIGEYDKSNHILSQVKQITRVQERNNKDHLRDLQLKEIQATQESN